MAGRKVAYRKRRQNRISMFLVSAVVLMIIIVVAVRGQELKERTAIYDAQIENLQGQISQEEKRAEENAELEKYTQTKKYAEEIATEKLGLVYEDEIIFEQEK